MFSASLGAIAIRLVSFLIQPLRKLTIRAAGNCAKWPSPAFSASDEGGWGMYDLREEADEAGLTLTPDEAALVDCVVRGEPFDGKNEKAITAAALRAIVLNMPICIGTGSKFKRITVPASGIIISNTTIGGSLDLTGARAADGGPSAALVLSQCQFRDPIILTRAHFRYLSLEGSTLPSLSAEDIFVDGSMRLSRINKAQAADTGAQINLEGGRINGALYADHGYFAGKDGSAFYGRNLRVAGHITFSQSIFEVWEPSEKSGETAYRALVIPDARIEGDLHIEYCAFWHCGAWKKKALAIIMADNATITGNVQINNTLLEVDVGADDLPMSPNMLFIHFNNVKVGGLFAIHSSELRCNFHAAGIEIGGEFEVHWSTLHGYLFMPNANIGGNYSIAASSVSGTVNGYLSTITGTLEIGATNAPTITYLSYGNFRSAAINGDLTVKKAAFRELDFGGATVRGTFEVEGNRPLRPSSFKDAQGDRLDISTDSKSIYPMGSDLTFNVGKRYAFDGQYYIDFAKHLYAVFDHNSISYAKAFEGLGMGFTGHAGSYVLCSLTWNAVENDYDILVLSEPDAIVLYAANRLDSISRKEAIQFARYCLKHTLTIDPDLKTRADAFLKPGHAYHCSGDDFRKNFGHDYSRLFVEFHVWLIRDALKADTWMPFSDWDAIARSIDCTHSNWRLNGFQVRELADQSGEGYGDGRLHLDEFKYEFIRDPSFDAKIKAESPSDGTFKVPVKRLRQQYRWQRFRNTIVRIQQELRSSRIDLVIDAFLLFGISFLLFFEPIRRLLPWGFRKSHDLLHGAFPHLPFAIGLLVPLIIIALFLNQSLKRSIHSMRKTWLDRQYINPSTPTADEFRPFPYEHLARYLRARGYDTDARQTLSNKLSLEHRLKTFVLFRPLMLLYRWGFEYGLSPQKAIGTFLAFLTVGWFGFLIADRGYIAEIPRPTLQALLPVYNLLKDTKREPVLMVATSTVNTTVVPTKGKEKKTEFAAGMTVSPTSESPPRELECGTTIQPSLYAIDVFIPAIDLRQESQCEISTEPRAAAWRWAKAIYSLLGWIITSLTILTVSGILRRQVEN